MSSLYLTDREMAAIKAIDSRALDERVRQALDERRASILSDLHLGGAHAAIAHHLYRFERDLEKHARAKAEAKRRETWSTAWSSGDDLKYTVSSLKQRMEDQKAEMQLVVIHDAIIPPHRFQERVEVDVHFRWRTRPTGAWSSGTINFFHNVEMRPDYSLPQPAQKPSSTKLEAQRQEALFERWDHLRLLALHAVREYLTTGGDGSAIPKSFQAKPGRSERFLNNFSCNFWETLGEPRERPRPLATSRTIPNSGSQSATSDESLTLNARVRHRLFGVGTVIHIDGDKVAADFGDRGTKRVQVSFLDLVPDEEADLD